MSEILEEGNLIIKYVEIELYVCRNCYHYFKRGEAETAVMKSETSSVSFDICPKCESSDILLNNFSLKVTNLEG